MLNLEGEAANQYSDGGAMYEVILKRFEQPDEIRTFEKGKFELIRIGGMTIGRATYEPGWRWSEHVGQAAGLKSCSVEHVGIVLSGIATAAMDDGRVIEMKAGDIFYIEPGHDSWVVGDEAYVSLHLMGASDYASKKKWVEGEARFYDPCFNSTSTWRAISFRVSNTPLPLKAMASITGSSFLFSSVASLSTGRMLGRSRLLSCNT